MSWMRYNYLLKYFKKGVTEEYVFQSAVDGKGKSFIEDWGSNYTDNKSLIELIAVFISDAIQDEELSKEEEEKYIWKMVKILAKKLRVEKHLRDKPLTDEELMNYLFDEQEEINGRT